jgi:hypothetical protein
MRSVDVRVMSPATRYQPDVCRFEVSLDTLQKVCALVLICAFWGVILFLALSAFH